MNICHVMTVFNGVETNLVSRSMDQTTLNSASRHPDRKSIDVMISTICPLCTWCPAEFAGEHHNR